MKKLLPISALLILIVVALLLLQEFNNAPELRGNVASDAPVADGLIAEIEQPDLPETEEAPVILDPPKVPGSIDPKFGLTLPDEVEPILHVPDYGPMLRRSGSKIDFKLVDANGRECELADSSVSLYRQLGSYWLREGCEIDAVNNRIACDGHSLEGQAGVGLEPGNYELEHFSSKWGNLRHEFSVDRNNHQARQIQTEAYLRRICFDFRDQHGNAVPWIYMPPSVSTSSDRLEYKKRHQPKQSFLVTPPSQRTTGGVGIGGGGGRGGSGGLAYRRSLVMYPTDDGRWYVLVWAGSNNTVRFKFREKLWGTDEIVFKGKFLEGSWDNHQVTLEIPDNFDELAGPRKTVSKRYTPGQEQETLDTLNPVRPDPRDALVERGWARVIARVAPRTSGMPVIRLKNSKLPACKFTHVSDEWVAEVPARESFSIGVKDAAHLWECATTTLHDGEIRKIDLYPFQSQSVMSCQGMPESLIQASFGFRWNLVADEEDFKVKSDTHYHLANGIFRQWEPGVPAEKLKKFVSKGHDAIVWSFTAPRNATSARRYGRSHILETKIEGNFENIAPAIEGMSWSKKFPGRLFARAVGTGGEGLPWVHGIVQPYEIDAIAQQVRSKSRLEDGTKLRIDIYDYVLSGYADGMESAMKTEGDARTKALGKLIGERNAKRLKTSDERYWFAENGAWYKSDSKLYTDDHGYIHSEQSLTPAKIYVLYLWSDSRDDLEPDARIVFKAGESFTDLGVIQLPSYR
ncbi:MAG: hypothetical protein ACYTDT_08115 [Planctomycetota bacterium]|jgi:hypothetical protein